MNKRWLSCVLALSLLGAPVVFAGDTSPDNSGANVRDRSGESKTPMDQSNSPEDLRITQEIRKSVTADDALSVNAQNVKIITVNGVVTLRGPVKTAAERDSIALKAKSVTGVTKVENNLEVATE